MLCSIFILETPRTVNPVCVPFWGYLSLHLSLSLPPQEFRMLRPDAQCNINFLEKGLIKRAGVRGIPDLVLNKAC